MCQTLIHFMSTDHVSDTFQVWCKTRQMCIEWRNPHTLKTLGLWQVSVFFFLMFVTSPRFPQHSFLLQLENRWMMFKNLCGAQDRERKAVTTSKSNCWGQQTFFPVRWQENPDAPQKMMNSLKENSLMLSLLLLSESFAPGAPLRV